MEYFGCYQWSTWGTTKSSYPKFLYKNIFSLPGKKKKKPRKKFNSLSLTSQIIILEETKI